MAIKEVTKAVIRLADGTEPAGVPLTHVCVEDSPEARKVFSELFAPYGSDAVKDAMTIPLCCTIFPARIDRTAEGRPFLNAVSWDAAMDDNDNRCLEFAEWIEIHSWYIIQDWNFGANEALILKESMDKPCISVFVARDDRDNNSVSVC